MQNAVQISDRFTVAKFAPDRDQLRRAAEEGFRSVVNMQTEGEEKGLGPQEERRAADEVGLTYLHHPVAGDKLSDEVVDGFRRKASELPAPVLVHCASGKRSGAMVIMHLAAEQGMTGEQVIKKAEEMGFECDSPEVEAFVKGYVDRHNGG